MPPPRRIMFIRHAEKPTDPADRGVAPDGSTDPESLDARGWQRALALATFFFASDLIPSRIFASSVEHRSHSRRPIETVTPLVDALARRGTPATFNTVHVKDDVDGLMADVLTGDGTTLVCWEHHKIPGLCGLIPGAPPVPHTWPDDRFDIVWIMDRTDGGWSFSQKPQLLLDGDSPNSIAPSQDPQ